MDHRFVNLCVKDEFAGKMNDKERTAWFSFVAVMAKFLGNKKAENYETLVANM